MMHLDAIDRLRTFRTNLYSCFWRRADALFELTDALLAADALPSLPHLSLVALHRRSWGSVYAALVRGRLQLNGLPALLAAYPLAKGQLIYAVDTSVWPRSDAEASPGRGFYYHPSRHSAGQPIVAGWAYQWLAQLSFERDSWTAPLDVRRVHPSENANAVAGEQIKALVARLPVSEVVPLFVFDAGYDSSQLTQVWRTSRSRSWCGCGRTAASTPTRRQLRLPRRVAARAGTGPSSTARTRGPGPSRPPSTPPKTSSMAPFAYEPGPACTPSSRCTRLAGPEGHDRLCVAR
jgi:hypothetical protein